MRASPSLLCDRVSELRSRPSVLAPCSLLVAPRRIMLHGSLNTNLACDRRPRNTSTTQVLDFACPEHAHQTEVQLRSAMTYSTLPSHRVPGCHCLVSWLLAPCAERHMLVPGDWGVGRGRALAHHPKTPSDHSGRQLYNTPDALV